MSNANASWIDRNGTTFKRYRGVKYSSHDRGYFLVGQASVGEFPTLASLKKYLDELAAFDRKPRDAGD